MIRLLTIKKNKIMKKILLLSLLLMIILTINGQTQKIKGDIKVGCITPEMDSIITIEKSNNNFYIKKRSVSKPKFSRVLLKLNDNDTINHHNNLKIDMVVSPNGKYIAYIQYIKYHPKKLIVYDLYDRKKITEIVFKTQNGEYTDCLFQTWLDGKMVFNCVNHKFNSISTLLYFGTVGRAYELNLSDLTIDRIQFKNEHGTLNDLGFRTYDYVINEPIFNDLTIRTTEEGSDVQIKNRYIGYKLKKVEDDQRFYWFEGSKKIPWFYIPKHNGIIYHHYSKHYIGLELKEYWNIGVNCKYRYDGYLAIVDDSKYLINIGRDGTLCVSNIANLE